MRPFGVLVQLAVKGHFKAVCELQMKPHGNLRQLWSFQ